MAQTSDARVRSALEVWAPTWPRRLTRRQWWASGPRKATRMLVDAEADPSNSPFISVYSFPNGHTSDGNAPRVSTLFIDFDFEDGDYEAGSGDTDAWRRDISHLLVRVRRVARYIRDSGRPGWRASLSGHKGVHLFLDFPPIEPEEGNLYSFINGMDNYANSLIDHIAEETGLRSLHNYVDVTSSDMGRLCRVPNTLHRGASESFGQDRFCVPVSIDELANLTVDDYIEYTSATRPMPWHSRHENERVGEIITQQIRNATSRATSRATKDYSVSYDTSLVDEYAKQSNDDITLGDVRFLTSDRPCVWKFHERDDKFQRGSQSHHMELFCIREMVEHNVPIGVMKEFFNNVDEYDSRETEVRIKEVIARDYERFNVKTNHRKAPDFCNYDDCGLCQRISND